MHLHRRPQSHESPFLSLPILIILLPILTLLVLFFTIPPLISFSSHVLRPHAVKTSWDSLNIFLVLFAILCGILTRKNDDGPDTNSIDNREKANEPVNIPSEDIVYHGDINTTEFGAPVTGYSRLKRNSSSYPDLRQESIWDTGESSLRFKFFDDFEVNKYSSCYNDIDNNAQKSQSVFKDSDVKEISVDSFVVRSPLRHPAKSPPPPPRPPPPPQAVQRKPRRTYHTVKKDTGSGSMQTPEPPAPPPLPMRRAQVNYQDNKYSKSGRKKINTRKEIKMFVSALYKQRKKKMHHIPKENSSQVQSDQVDQYMSYMQRATPPPPPPPPPPPQLPTHSVFHNLFKKGSKSKKIHSHSPPPLPPPLPSVTKTRKPPPEIPVRIPSDALPPRPSRLARKINGKNGNGVNIGNHSPLIPMPPPPLMKFVDVKSRCSSPEPEDIEFSASDIGNVMNGGDGGNSVFCPSPDVNVKADTFIARLKDGWRLEKINSLREKHNQNAGSGLGSENRTISSLF